MRYSLTKENRLNISYRYLYDGGNLIRIEKGSGTSLQYIDFLYDGVMLCGFRFGDLYTSYHRIYYYLYGHGGNVEGILDAGGNLLVRYTYDAWGNFIETINTSDAGALAALALNPFRYRGYVYDYETGFYYLQSRYYDPETGRFISADGEMAGVGGDLLGYNLFAYCQNDPVNKVDPTGNWPKNWKEFKEYLKEKKTQFTDWFNSMFGAAVVQSQTYDVIKMETILCGYESGESTKTVIVGDVSKPVSVYVTKASKWWKTWEYKIGVQVNIKDGGFGVCMNGSEISVIASNGNDSLELMTGIRKIGYTVASEVDFGKFSAETYIHGYVRPIPIALAGVAMYFTKGLVAAPVSASIW